MSNIALTITASSPVWTTQTATKAVDVSAYTHEIVADGGYKSASFSVNGNKNVAEGWLFENIGNDIKVYNSANTLVWRGFVNKVSITLGTLSVSRGPLIDTANSVYGKYQTPSYTIDGTTVGGNQQTTAATSNAKSIAKYGTRNKMLSIGTANSTEADQVINTYLLENKEPQISYSVTIGGDGNDVTIQVECLGYMAMLDYIPDNTGSGNGTINLNDKIEAVLTAEPDGIFSTDYNKIETNTTQVSQYWELDRTAGAIIKSLVSLGSPSPDYERTIWGIYDDLQMVYKKIPTVHEYQHRLHHNKQAVVDANNNEVYPWDVLPGKYVFVSDFLIGQTLPASDLKTDPRIMFIESVKYTAPWGLSLTGGKTNTLDQKLSRLNLGAL